MAGFAELMASLESADFFIGVLPFVITYAIFFLTLSNAPKFKENDKMTTLVSASIAFMVSYFVISTAAYQYFFVNYFGSLTVGLLGIMGLFVAFALTGLIDKVSGANWWGLLVVVLVAVAWTTSGGLAALPLGGFFTGNGTVLVAAFDYLIDTGLIWAVLIVALIAWSSGEERPERFSDRAYKWLSSTPDHGDHGGGEH